MSPLDVADNTVTAYTERVSPAYVPPLQRTEGQPPPIAAHGGLSYMSFDRDGDGALRGDQGRARGDRRGRGHNALAT